MNMRSGVGMMPGGIQFIDPREPRMKWMDDHTFLNERIQEVIQFRAANPVLYRMPADSKFLNPELVAQEIVDFNAARLNNDKNYFYDNTLQSVKNVELSKGAAPPDKKCLECLADLMPRYCPTCGGHKIIGYECPVCNKRYD
jgi:hypothetical protein